MSDWKSAKAAENSTIIQSGGDTTIGLTTAQMREVIEAVADQIPKYAAIASGIVEARLADLEDRIIKRFENDGKTKTEAFSDPDFQYMVRMAQHGYARSGDDTTADVLVSLIAERSKENSRSRLSLSLSGAAETAAYLTNNEFAALALTYLLRYTKRTTIGNFVMLCENIRKDTEVFIDDISRESSSYSYMIAKSCASSTLAKADLYEIFTKGYPGVLCLGFSEEEAKQIAGNRVEIDDGRIFVPCIHDNSKLQINAIDVHVLRQKADHMGIPDLADSLWELHKSHLFDEEQFRVRAKEIYPRIDDLFDVWNNTMISSIELTSIGIALGYCNLKRCTDWNSDLGIWIK